MCFHPQQKNCYGNRFEVKFFARERAAHAFERRSKMQNKRLPARAHRRVHFNARHLLQSACINRSLMADEYTRPTCSLCAHYIINSRRAASLEARALAVNAPDRSESVQESGCSCWAVAGSCAPSWCTFASAKAARPAAPRSTPPPEPQSPPPPTINSSPTALAPSARRTLGQPFFSHLYLCSPALPPDPSRASTSWASPKVSVWCQNSPGRLNFFSFVWETSLFQIN